MNLWYWGARIPANASEWFARLRAGEASSRTDAQFREWLAQDAQNECAYERQELAWEVVLELKEDSEIQRFIHQAESATVSPDRHLPLWESAPFRFGLATAASILMAITGLLWWYPDSSTDDLYTTNTGEQRTVILADQSQMMLNTATRVRVVYTKSLRRIYLEQGEATFNVAHDKEHPFEVSTDSTKARVLGTEFNVLKSRQGVTISVLEGRVEVLPAIANTRRASTYHAVLSEGEEVVYSDGQLSPIRVAQLQRINAWHNRKVVFQDVTLEEALTEFNRYTTTQLVLGDSSLRAYRVTGVFRVGEIQALLNALKEAFDVRAEQKGNSIILWQTKVRNESITAQVSNRERNAATREPQ